MWDFPRALGLTLREVEEVRRVFSQGFSGFEVISYLFLHLKMSDHELTQICTVYSDHIRE
jgi:hypothetical protein